MRQILTLAVALFLLSCNAGDSKKPKEVSSSGSSAKIADFTVAVRFINYYVEHCKREFESHTSDTNWIDRNQLLTDHFKEVYHNLLDSAKKADPELGLDCDPIFNAQDYPHKGFSLASCDSANGYVTVVATDQNEFTGGFPLVLRVVHQNGALLVDGVGMINIPEDKRAKR